MSFFSSMFGKEEPEGDGFSRKTLYQGDVGGADPNLAEGLQKVMQYCLNADTPEGRGIREIGAKMSFEMRGIVAEAREGDESGKTINEGVNLGDYEVSVRRLR